MIKASFSILLTKKSVTDTQKAEWLALFDGSAAANGCPVLKAEGTYPQVDARVDDGRVIRAPASTYPQKNSYVAATDDGTVVGITPSMPHKDGEMHHQGPGSGLAGNVR